MLGKVSLVSAVALCLGLSAVHASQPQNGFELDKAKQKEQAARGITDAADPVDALMVELRESGLTQPQLKLDLVQERIAEKPELLTNPKTALALWDVQTQLVIDHVNSLPVRNGAERLRLLNQELAKLEKHNKAVKELMLKGDRD